MQGLILSCFIQKFILVKGTVGVISSHFPLKEWNVGFTTVPLKALSAQNCMRYQSFSLSKFIIFKCGFSLINETLFKQTEITISKGLKVTVVDLSCALKMNGYLEITTTVLHYAIKQLNFMCDEFKQML